MKKYVFKGQPGYFKNRKTKLMIGSICGFALMLILFIVGYIIAGSPRNLFSVGAVIVVLPTAKIYVQYAMIPWKSNADEVYLEELKLKYPTFDFHAELLITGSEKRFPIMYLAINKDDNIIAMTNDSKCDPKLFEKAVVNFLNYYNYDSKVKLYLDTNNFEKKIKQISAAATEVTAEDKEHMETVFSKISIMSI